MKKIYTVRVFIVCLMALCTAGAFAQPVTTTFTNNNGNSLITFNFVNNNTSAIIITDISSITGVSGANSGQLWYKTTPIAGSPGPISAANGWTLLATQSFTGVANTTTSTPQLMMTGLSLMVPASTTYGLAYTCTSLRYSTLTAGTYTASSGGCDIVTGTNIGYGGGVPPATPANTPRGFIGSVNFMAAVPCAGTPAPGNTLSTANPVCPANSFTLSLQFPTSGTGVSYQWQSSPTGASYTNIAGATTSTYTTTQTVATYYQCIVTCATSGATTTSNPLLVNMNPFMSCYCSSAATTTADEEITNVTLSSLINISNCTTPAPGPGSILARYSNFMSGTGAPAAPSITMGTAYPLSVTVGSCGTFNYTSGLAIFMDLNHNGSFADAGEKVYSNGPTANINCVPSTVVTGSITVPMTAMSGTTAMRVIDAEGYSGDAITPCLSYGYGETEDYLVNLVAPVACSGTPSAGTANASPSSVITGQTFTLSLSGASTSTGLTFQWQSSPDGVTWTNIAGATSSTYSTTETANTYFQCIVTCVASGSSATSSSVLVTYTAAVSMFTGTVNMCSGNFYDSGGPSGNYANSEAYTLTIYPSTPGASLQVTFSSFALEVGYDYLSIYNGNSMAAPLIGTYNATSPGTVTSTAADGSLTFRFTSDGSVVYAGWVASINCIAACTGTPTAGTASSSMSSVCSGANFNLLLSGYTVAGGVTIQWQSSPDGTTWSNIAGATSATYTTNQSDTMYYQAIVSCTGSGMSATSNVIAVYMNPPMACYCTPPAQTIYDEEITNVTVSTLNNTSDCTTPAPGPGSIAAEYANYTSGAGAPAAPNLMKLIPQSFSVTVGSCGTYNYTSGLAIFIDLNQDGDFVDAGEKVYSNGPTSNINCVPATVVTGSFTIPTTAMLGNTVMRIIDAEGYSGDAITPCLVYYYGETEDYLINIQPQPPIDMTPLSLVFPTSVSCNTTSDSVVIQIKNNGSAVMDYSMTPVTVNAAVTGVNPATFGPIVLNTGTLAIGATQNVTVATGYNTTAAGSYTFTANTNVAGDGFTGNDTLAGTTINVTGVVAMVDNDTVCPNDSVHLDVQLPPTTFTIGTGTVTNTTTTYPAPYGNWYWGARHQFLISAADLSASGMSAGPISSLAFDVVTTNGIPLQNFEIKLKNTPTTSLTAWETGATSVFTIASYIPVVGLNTHTFSTPFNWDGTSSLLVEVCFNNTSYTQNCVVNQTTTTYNSSLYYYQDASGVCGVSTTYGNPLQRPNMRFTSTVPYTYSWTPVTGLNNPTIQNPSALVMSSTTYSVVVTNPATGCNKSSSVAVFANPAPMMTLNDTTVCAGAVYTLDAQNSGSSYMWNTGATTQTIGVSSNGLYFVDITNTFGCDARDSMNLTLNAQPVVALGADVAFCAGDSITLDAGNTGFMFLWNTGATTQTVNASTAGPYDVTVTNPSTGCKGMDTINVMVNPLPLVNLGPDTAICIGDSLVLDAGNPGDMYSWQDASSMQTFTAMTAGTYNVLVTDPSTTCAKADTMTLAVNPLPVVDLGADTAICAGNTLTLDAGNPGSTYMWQDATTMQTNPAMTAGTYGVLVTDMNGCKNSDTLMLTVNPLPMVDIGPDTTQCGGSITLDAGNPGDMYMWQDASAAQTLTATATGNYYVTVTDGNGCSKADSAMVTINPVPVPSLGADVVQCGGSVTMDAGNPGLSYMWSNSTTNQTFTTFISGGFGVTVTDTLTGCNSSDSMNVTINPAPTVNLGADTTQCGGVITLDAGAGATSYMWSTGATTQTITVSSSANVDVTIGNSFGCTDIDTISVTINPLPGVGMAPFSTPVCLQAAAFVLTNGMPAGGTYSGTGVTGSMFDPSAAGVGVFPITYSVTDTNSCQNSTAQNITVQDCSGVEEYAFGNNITVYPNPTSGMFSIAIANANFNALTISVTDIQGQEVFRQEDKNISNEYNKQINLEELAKGIYYIRLSAGSELSIKKLIIQ
jgi:hypothetical protein